MVNVTGDINLKLLAKTLAPFVLKEILEKEKEGKNGAGVEGRSNPARKKIS